MKTTRTLTLCATLALATVTALRADNEFEKQIAGNFFLPEQIMKSKDILSFSEEQQSTLRNAYESAQQKINSLNESLRAEVEKLNELTKARKLDEKAVLAQGDKVLEAERVLKHEELAMLVLIKNSLTPEQQATLNGIKALDPKIKQVKELAEKWKAEGKDLSQFEPMKSEFESDLKQGKGREAESLLDHVLQILNGTTAK